MVVNDTKIFGKQMENKSLKMGNKSLLNIEKNIIRCEKTPYYDYKKLISFIKSISILKSNDVENSLDEE